MGSVPILAITIAIPIHHTGKNRNCSTNRGCKWTKLLIWTFNTNWSTFHKREHYNRQTVTSVVKQQHLQLQFWNVTYFDKLRNNFAHTYKSQLKVKQIFSSFCQSCQHWRIWGGREGRTPPLGVQILSISCSFRENLACSRPPWRVHAPPRENPGSATGQYWLTVASVVQIGINVTILTSLTRSAVKYKKVTARTGSQRLRASRHFDITRPNIGRLRKLIFPQMKLKPDFRTTFLFCQALLVLTVCYLIVFQVHFLHCSFRVFFQGVFRSRCCDDWDF